MKWLATALLVATLPAPASPAATTPPPSVVTAARAAGSITLDGRLDEPAWRDAGVISDLVQQAPHPAVATPFRTEVRVLADEANLYIGVKAFDPEPDRIAIHTMQRDGEMEGDDTVAFVIDTFGDARTGYLFRINPAGARQDGLISAAGSLSLDWDGIWDVRTQREADGWTAEVVIPTHTLRFRKGRPAWGFNVERTIARDRLVLRWVGDTLDVRFDDLSRAGSLAGLENLKQGLGLSVIPYGLSRWERETLGDERTLQGDGGLDVAYQFTPGLASFLTVNTDFAETEVDTRQINLTRFDLFFPEKRAFFLEGASLFNFATGLGTEFIPFYSRRVGLAERDGEMLEVPIDAGLKVLGRAGRWGIGALDVRTGDSDAAPATKLFAGRVTFDAGDHLKLGTIFTHGDPDGVDDNALGGLDAVWHTSTFRGNKNFTTGIWAARTAGDLEAGQEGRRAGWGFKADYPNDLWELSVGANEFGGGFDPALGFVQRTGVRTYEAGAAFQPRPTSGAFSWVRQFFFELYPSRVDNLDGFVESWSIFTAPFNVETRTGEHLEANWEPRFERLTEETEIAGVIIPAGSYRFDRYRVEAQSSRHRSWRIGTTLWFGGFYDGRLAQLGQFVTWSSAGGRLQLQLERESDTGRVRAGRIAQRLWQVSAAYAFTPGLVLSTYGQYDLDSMGANTRLRWTIRPGTDLFVVWNRNWQDPDPVGDGRSNALPLRSDQASVKLRWTFKM